ncbi:MAG TPA: hypothetical protein VHC22_12550 [Pirellulales bacterium]|nr:hypothetical protein [Pirellulales bacterium]
MPRQFSLKTLLWLMMVVGAFLGGMALQRQLDKPLRISKFSDPEGGEHEVMVTRDKSMWLKYGTENDE